MKLAVTTSANQRNRNGAVSVRQVWRSVEISVDFLRFYFPSSRADDDRQKNQTKQTNDAELPAGKITHVDIVSSGLELADTTPAKSSGAGAARVRVESLRLMSNRIRHVGDQFFRSVLIGCRFLPLWFLFSCIHFDRERCQL